MSTKVINSSEVEKLRLVLSSYQDGTGQYAQSDGSALPGWRDFERSVALIFGGIAQESKAIFDILVPISGTQNYYGISCKMRGELKTDTSKQEVVPVELSNATKQFWTEIKDRHKIYEQTYKEHPDLVGQAIISLVQRWHKNASAQMRINIDLDQSFYLVLLWNKKGNYQLFQFPHQLPNPESLHWHFPQLKNGSISNHLQGDNQFGKRFEWYGESGGQLKYYPRVEDALWKSEPFRLEPLPQNTPNRILARVKKYFPDQWSKIEELGSIND